MVPVAPFPTKPTTNTTNRLPPLKMTDMASSRGPTVLLPHLLEVWLTKSHVMLKKRGQFVDSLWYSREDGSLFLGTNFDVQAKSAPFKLCHSYGLIGKIKFLADSEWYLLLIKDAKPIGNLPPANSSVYCIERVILIPLSVEKSIEEIKMETYAQDRRDKDVKEKGKLEKKLREALLQMFNGSKSFYFSYSTDLTQSVQRKHNCGEATKLRKWQQVDERFFWNKEMLTDLLNNDNLGQEVDDWILPIIQGYIEIKEVPIPSTDHLGVFEREKPPSKPDHVTTTEEREKGGVDIPVSNEDVPLINNQAPPTQLYDDEFCIISEDLISSTPVGSAHSSNDLLDTLTPKVSPKKSYERVKDETTPTLMRRSQVDDTLSCGSCDTDDLADERLEEQVPLQQQLLFNEEEHLSSGDQQFPWSGGNDMIDEGEGQGAEFCPTITIALISRRSRHRAGTRYLRRGVDGEGCVANYVETEMVLQVSTHLISFLVVRGSVPVYWTQPGNKYRPLPIIQQTDEETAEAFERHFETQINLYEKEVIINLINQTGRERIVSEAYEKQLIRLNCPSLTYVAFDFHRYCKVNQWYNINMLLDRVEEYVNEQKYFWVDLQYDKGPLCQQQGVFRVNCMDCLDRTNVVQSVLCKEIIQTALQKLSLLTPFGTLSGHFLRHYQELWANNGDTISRQYTGTAAMKGDLTRYGHRRLYGVMKDGYNSAHRYLQSLFRDAYRQVVIDLQQGISPVEALSSLSHSQRGLEDDEQLLRPPTYTDLPSWSSEREQVIADMIKTCRDNLFPNTTVPVKGWALIEPSGYSFVPTSDNEEDTVLLLCIERRHVCVANYNSDFDQVACCIRIPLDRIDRITIGPMGTILRSSRRLYLRLHYTLFPGCSCYFTFRSVHSLSLEEDKLTLLTLAEELAAIQPTIAIQEQRLSKKISPPHEGIVYLIAPSEWTKDPWETVLSPRNKEGGGETRFYDQLSNSSSTISHQSCSSASGTGIVALVNYGESRSSSESDHHGKSGYETDESGDREEEEEEEEVSFSAPSSPNLVKRRNVMSLRERSRLLSHSSLEDLTTKSIGGERRVRATTVAGHKRRASLGFVILESAPIISSGAEANDEAEEEEEENEIVDISEVLSTSRLNSIHFPDTLNHGRSTTDNLLPVMRPRIPSPPPTLQETATKRPVKRQLSEQLDKLLQETATATTASTLSPNLSLVEALSDTTNTTVDTSDSTANEGPSTGKVQQRSRWKIGKLFQKPLSKQSSSNTSGAESSGGGSLKRNNVVQAIGILKGLRTKAVSTEHHNQDEEYSSSTGRGEESEGEETTVVISDWLQEAIKTSKTKFIII